MKKSKTVGLGWANRAVSGKKVYTVNEGLLRLADDLEASIRDAYWKADLKGPTLHMAMAVSAYFEWKRANNV